MGERCKKLFLNVVDAGFLSNHEHKTEVVVLAADVKENFVILVSPRMRSVLWLLEVKHGSEQPLPTLKCSRILVPAVLRKSKTGSR